VQDHGRVLVIRGESFEPVGWDDRVAQGAVVTGTGT